MDITVYRRQFASFNSSFELARYEHPAGPDQRFDPWRIYDRYSDLFSIDAINDLKRVYDQVSPDLETERESLRRLLLSAQRHFAEIKASEVTNELAHCESSSTVAWRGETFDSNHIWSQLARISDAASRDELTARWLDSISSCDDLRLARCNSLEEAASSLGFDSYAAMVGTSDSSLTQPANLQSLWQETEAAYHLSLSKLFAREFPGEPPRELNLSDVPFFQKVSWLDFFFARRSSVEVHAEVMRRVGVRGGPQQQVHVTSTPRLHAEYFAVEPPRDVRLTIPSTPAASTFLEGMAAAASAQSFSWCSSTLAARHPEFVYATEPATGTAYGFLFKYLAADEKWLMDFLPAANEAQVRKVAEGLKFELALTTRLLVEACMVESSTEAGQSTYKVADEQIRPLLVRFNQTHRKDRTQPSVQLRALAFSFVLREHLRTRYGSRWWTTAKAGDELVDLWSTGCRYSVEELSQAVSSETLSFALLTDAINEAG